MYTCIYVYIYIYTYIYIYRERDIDIEIYVYTHEHPWKMPLEIPTEIHRRGEHPLKDAAANMNIQWEHAAEHPLEHATENPR